MVTYGYNITTSHITCLLTSSIGTLTVVVYGILKKKEPRPDIPPNEKKRLQHNLAERKKITDGMQHYLCNSFIYHTNIILFNSEYYFIQFRINEKKIS